MISRNLETLIDLACRNGATAAAVIEANVIVVREDLAELCKKPQCRNYNTSANCPPTSGGADRFRNLLVGYRQALILKIDTPREIFFTDQRQDIARLMHHIASTVEREAVRLGSREPKAFVSGGCKHLFCNEHADCRVLAENKECRHADIARPSMSGYGVDVSQMISQVGWRLSSESAEGENDEIYALVALVLL